MTDNDDNTEMDFVYDLDLFKHPPNRDINNHVIYQQQNHPKLFCENKINADNQYVPLIRKYQPKNRAFAINCRIVAVHPLYTDYERQQDVCSWLLTNGLYYNVYKAALAASSRQPFYIMRIVDELPRTYCTMCNSPIQKCDKYNKCTEYMYDDGDEQFRLETAFKVYEQNIMELVISQQNERTGVISPTFIFAELKHAFSYNLDYERFDSEYNYRTYCFERKDKLYVFSVFSKMEELLEEYAKLKCDIRRHFAKCRLTDDLMDYIGEFL